MALVFNSAVETVGFACTGKGAHLHHWEYFGFAYFVDIRFNWETVNCPKLIHKEGEGENQ